MSNNTNKENIINKLLSDCKTIAQKQRVCEMMGLSFEWPSIEDQIVNQGSIESVKRGRAKYGRELFVVPGFEVPGHAPFPGFVCHPAAALAAATELIRLYKENKESCEI